MIKIDEAKIHSHLDSMVRDTVEETLNKMLGEEADRLCHAERYEHTEARKDTRAGYYKRQLHVKAGVVHLNPTFPINTKNQIFQKNYHRS